MSNDLQPPHSPPQPRNTLTKLPALETPESVASQLMPEDEITLRIRKAEEHAKRDYAGYRRGVLGFAVLGYLYILFVPLVLLLLVLGALWLMAKTKHVYGIEIQFVFGLVIALFAYIRALWVSIPPPEGVKLERGDYPELFNLVDQLSQKLNIKVDYVMADDAFNAMVVQRPRLGFFGWYENYVVLGLPLMQSLPPEQFKSVLAHEFGHISGNHGKSNSFIYNQRVRLVQLLVAMHQHSQIAMAMLSRFYDWYYPRFSASSLVIVREHEKQADRQAAEITSNECCGEALALTEVKGAQFERIMTDMTDKIRELEAPPDLIYFEVGEKLSGAPEDKEKALEGLAHSLSKPTGHEDTHPALAERLRVVNFPEPRMVAEALYDSLPLAFEKGQSSAEVYFGRKLPSLVQHFSDGWTNAVKVDWKNLHVQMVEAEAQLIELTEKSQSQELTLEEMIKMASLSAGKNGMEIAIPLYENVLAKDPKNLECRFVVGAYWLDKKDERGVEMLRSLVSEKNTQFSLYACSVLREHFEKKGMKNELKSLDKIWYDQQIVLSMAGAERQGIERGDLIGPHNLSEATVRNIVEHLQKEKGIKEVYLYCKLMQHLPEQKFYILAVVPKANMGFGLDSSNREVEVRLHQEIKLPDAYLIKVIDSSFSWMKDNAVSLPNALIFKQ